MSTSHLKTLCSLLISIESLHPAYSNLFYCEGAMQSIEENLEEEEDEVEESKLKRRNQNDLAPVVLLGGISMGSVSDK